MTSVKSKNASANRQLRLISLTTSRSISASLDASLSLGGMTKFRLKEIAALAPEHICISPGPCTPREAGISKDLVLAFGARTPILGVCLGHQCIAEAYGGEIVRASTADAREGIDHHDITETPLFRFGHVVLRLVDIIRLL